MPTLSSETEPVNEVVVENWCKTSVKVIKLSYTFLISSVGCRVEKLGEAIVSSIFTCDKIQWRLKFYLNGKDEENKDCIGLYLELISTSKSEVYAKYTFSFLNSNQEKKHKWVSAVTTFVQGTVVGCPKFVKRDLVFDKANGLLMDDEFNICCDIDVASDIINGQLIPVKLKIPEAHLSEDLSKLFQSRKFCDVVLSVNGHDFYAHKNILSARSAVFAAMFEHGMKESKESKVDITDMNCETVKEMLSFIYTGKISDLGERATDLLIAANKYALDRLKVMCEEALCLNLSVDNASDVLVLADMHDASKLKAHAIDFIALHAVDVKNTSSWKAMELLHPHLITELCKTSAVSVIKHMCHNQVNVTKLSYTWIIDNFSFCLAREIQSSIFSGVSDEQKWCLKLHPNGCEEVSKGYVSLHLKLISFTKSEVLAKLYFMVLNSSFKTVKHDCNENLCLFVTEDQMWGCEKFVKRTFLLDESNGLLTSDRLILRCNLTVFSEPVNISLQNHTFKFKVPACDLSDDFRKLFESQKFSDVTLNVMGQELHAHKNLLSARSPVFAAVFQHEMNTLQITDVGCEVFKEMLHFLYTGNVPNLEKMAVDLLVIANRYALERLKVMCEDHLSSNLCIDNACDTLILAEFNSAGELKVRVIDFISFHIDAVVLSNGWKTLEKHHVHLMTEIYGVLHKSMDLTK